MAVEYRITTVDNPYDPYTQWDDWYFYDISMWYCTCERLARLADIVHHLPPEVSEGEVNSAMDQLIFTGAFDKNGNFVEYKKVKDPNIKDNDQK